MSLAHRDVSRFSKSIYDIMDDGIFNVFTIFHWGTLFWNCSTISMQFFANCSTLPLTSNPVTKLMPLNLVVARCSSCFILVPLTFPALRCPQSQHFEILSAAAIKFKMSQSVLWNSRMLLLTAPDIFFCILLWIKYWFMRCANCFFLFLFTCHNVPMALELGGL